MWVFVLRAIETAIVLGGAAGGIYSAKLWLQAQKHLSISEAKEEAIRVARTNAEAWKSHYEATKLELTKYRADVLAKNDESNARIVKLTADNASLMSKTDLSPVLAFQAQQTTVNERIVTALDLVVQHLTKPAGRKRKN